jgi:subtilisin-like proprotein convertase family protein
MSKVVAATLGLVLAGAVPAARAALYGFTQTAGPGGSPGAVFTAGGTDLGQVIADNSPVGVAYGFNFSDIRNQITDVRVTLNISGGYNGDLYAYLSHGPGFVVLLNRVGVTPGESDGYDTAGFHLTLTSSGYDIHSYQGAGYPAPAYNGAGQLVNGSTPYGADDPVGLSRFNHADPNGMWTLFFADLAAGDVARLESFSLEITAVPEPVATAVAIAAGLFAAFRARRAWGMRQRPTHG